MNDLTMKKKTIEAMTSIYCKDKHFNRHQKPCPLCDTFLTYALERLEKCPQKTKMNCKTCSVHCFSKPMRNYARAVMRHTGKHMTYRHPYLTMRFMIGKLGKSS